MPSLHAPKLFMGATAIGAQGVMQADVVLVAAERRMIDPAEQVILLVDFSKFACSSSRHRRRGPCNARLRRPAPDRGGRSAQIERPRSSNAVREVRS